MVDKFKVKYGFTTPWEIDCINALSVKDYEAHINSSPHIVTLSLNAPRVRLYITKVKGVNRSIYEYNSGKTVVAVHRFSESLFEKDLLLVGYLLDSRVFMVEDIIINRGEDVSSLPIDKRLVILNEIIDQHYVPDPVLETNSIVVKEYVEYDFLHSFYTEHALKQSYSLYINGLVFCPLGPGRNIRVTPETELLTRKTGRILDPYAERHTIVANPAVSECIFTVKKTQKPDVYELYLLDKEGLIRYYDIACVPTKDESKKIKRLLSGSGCPIKCIFNREFGRWMPYERSNKKVNTISYLQAS